MARLGLVSVQVRRQGRDSGRDLQQLCGHGSGVQRIRSVLHLLAQLWLQPHQRLQPSLGVRAWPRERHEGSCPLASVHIEHARSRMCTVKTSEVASRWGVFCQGDEHD